MLLEYRPKSSNYSQGPSHLVSLGQSVFRGGTRRLVESRLITEQNLLGEEKACSDGFGSKSWGELCLIWFVIISCA